VSTTPGLLLGKPSRSGAEALRGLRARSRSLARDLNCLAFDWPTATDLLEHAARLVGDALRHATRGNPPVLATIIVPPVHGYVADAEGEELARFVRLMREIAARCVQEVGGVSVLDGDDAWRLGAEPFIGWYWSAARDPCVLRVRRARLGGRSLRSLNYRVLAAITARNRAAFDGHLRSFLPELAHVDEGG
jgi:hypothetical protein